MDVEISKLFQENIIEIDREDYKLILDIKKLIEYDFKLYDKFLKEPREFIEKINYVAKDKFNINEKAILFLNWRENKDISHIRVEDLNDIVKIDGMISKITEPLSLVVSRSWECPSCGTILHTPGKNPSRCSCGRGGGFKESSTELIDIQELVLEELQERISGRQPQKIRVRLTKDLTSKKMASTLRAGNRISIIGVIDKIKLVNKEEEEIFQYRVFALSLSNLDEKFDDKISDKDMIKIKEISELNPMEILKDSIAPNIYGRDDLKRILLLQMMGGVQKTLGDGKLTRNWINILVVGSPSTSKSELAKNIHLRTPGSFYSSGDNASGVGLTVAMERDEFLGNWGVSIGPIVKASGSTAIVDEIDKFPKGQLKALHTPLESGYVKLSKAGIDATFPSETALLALANPKHGIFEDTKSLVEQIDLPPALLSRFDIIYILKDDINKDVDDKIVEIIYTQEEISHENLINVSLFRKYITHAKGLKPKLLKEHLGDLKNFYNDVRKKSVSKDSNMKGMPIGTRHLQGLIRLAEASAKLRLSDTVDKEDFDLAKKLFYDSLLKIGMDEGGLIDLARMGHGKTVSARKLRDVLMDSIRILYSEGKDRSDVELRRIMSNKSMSNEDYDKTIYELNREGTIIKSGGVWVIT